MPINGNKMNFSYFSKRKYLPTSITFSYATGWRMQHHEHDKNFPDQRIRGCYTFERWSSEGKTN